jgi:hypothetical protein
MDGQAPPAAGIADTIETFMTSIHVAQDMFLAGLPCWLIRKSKTFGDEKIFSVAEVFHPKNYIGLGPHKFNYPMIYTGPAADLEKFTAIKKFACNFRVPKIPLEVHPHHWLELRSLLPLSPLTLLFPVQLQPHN